MRHFFNSILLIAISYAGMGQSSTWIDLKKALEGEKDPKMKVERYLDIGYHALDYGIDSVMHYADEAQSLAAKNDNVTGIISALSLKGIHTRIIGQHDESIAHFERAIKLNDELDNEKRGAQLMDNLANVYVQMGQIEKAIGIKEECVHIFKTIKDSISTVIALNGLGDIMISKQDYIGSEKYFKEAVRYTKDDSRLSRVYGNLGISYKHQEKLDSALHYYLLGIKTNQGHPYYMAGSHANIAILYKSKKEIESAAYHYEQANQFALKSGNEPLLSRIQIATAFLDIEMKKFAAAEKKLATAGPAVLASGKISSEIDYHKARYMLAEATGQNKNALASYIEYRSLKDSVDNLTLNTKVAEFEEKYESAEKEKQLALQEEKILRQKNQRNLLIAGSLFLLWFGLFGILFFWNRNRLNKVISSQNAAIQNQKITKLEQEKKLLAVSAMLEGQENERMRIAQDLHDSIGGILTSVKAHFGIIEKEIAKIESLKMTAQVNHLIDEASTEVRRISHNMAPRSLRLFGLKAAVEDLANQAQANENLEVKFEWNGGDLPLNEASNIMLYRAIQECIQNAIKHAAADQLLVQVNVFETEGQIIIEDNGKGFEVYEAKKKASLGLKSIESRVQYLGGELDIDTRVNEGTTVNINLDWKKSSGLD